MGRRTDVYDQDQGSIQAALFYKQLIEDLVPELNSFISRQQHSVPVIELISHIRDFNQAQYVMENLSEYIREVANNHF